jgi:quaternary ammonium compound-resistance protein SugE
MNFKSLTLLRWDNFYVVDQGIPILIPFLGYILFGIGNIVCFSQAIKVIPTATAFGIWTAATLILLKIADSLFFHQKISWLEVLFMFLIGIGIVGLKFVANTN